jgi:hypothetical protein
MGCSSILIASRSYPSVRRHIATGVTVASAGVLALGLVVIQPDPHGARTEVGAVQLATLRLPGTAHLDALERFIVEQTQTVRHVSEAIAGGAADIPAAFLKTADAGVSDQRTVDSVNDPAISTQSVEAAALATPTAAVSILDPILGILSPILGLLTNPGALLLFGPIILLVVLACPPCAIFNFVTGIFQSFLIDLTPVPLVAAAATAVVDEKTATDMTSTGEPVLGDVSSATATTPSADISPAPRSKKPDESPAEPATENEQTSTETATSTKDVTETAKTEEASTDPAAASATQSSASEDASEPEKPKARPAPPRPVVREPLGSNELRPSLRERGNGAKKTESSSAASSSTENNSSGDDSSGGGADGSE